MNLPPICENSDCCPPIPASIMTASRCELEDLTLKVEGELPSDLQGHVFIVAPVGTVDSGGLPFLNGDSMLNGDGMVYRLDLNQPIEVKLKTRLLKPPDYYADKATRPGGKYEKYRFRNHGVTRFSLTLGFRNELNTAFLPMKFADSSLDRLLVTYDGGRPYEIDTETLEVVTPIGSNQEWVAEIDKPKFPFKPILSTAHPAFDAYTQEMFTVNYGRSIDNFLETIPVIVALEQFPEILRELMVTLTGFLRADLLKYLLSAFLQFSKQVFDFDIRLIEKCLGVNIQDFVYLVRWNGQGNLERWKLVLPDGKPLRIEQTIHQIGVTQDYVILMDTAFTTGTEQVLNNPFPENKNLEEVLREVLESPALSDSNIYIVRRRDLVAGQKPACSSEDVEVRVKKVVIPLSAAHFLVNYENPDGKVTLHIAHICAWDVAEWIRQYDKSAYYPYAPVLDRVQSMEHNEMDISRLGCYVVDAETATVVKSHLIDQTPYTWGTGLYAYRERLSDGRQPKQLDNIYWTSFGLWKDLMTQYMVDLYRNYKYRVVPMSELLCLAEKGIPSCLFRVHISDNGMAIADSYEFPRGYIGSSPQFIPRKDSSDDSTNGYLLCTVFTPEQNEYWIFDARKLANGPVCKLSHPSLNFGFSLHTAWLPKIGRRQASYNIPVQADFQDLVDKKERSHCNKLKTFFEQEVYPHFPPN